MKFSPPVGLRSAFDPSVAQFHTKSSRHGYPFSCAAVDIYLTVMPTRTMGVTSNNDTAMQCNAMHMPYNRYYFMRIWRHSVWDASYSVDYSSL